MPALAALLLLAAFAMSTHDDVLVDSEIAYHAAGANGNRVDARLVAKDGRVTVELKSGSDRSASPVRGTMRAEDYRTLWRKAEQNGIWTLTVPDAALGADSIDYALRIRSGSRVHSVTWNRRTASLPEAQLAEGLGQKVIAAAREATAVR
jgi:hypothetical protein